MSVLLHISDTHFGTERPQVVEALLDLAAQQRPDLVVLSGDITQRARPAQFQQARAFSDRLGVRVLAIPGNHDIPLLNLVTRLSRPYARYAAAFGSDLEPVQESPEWLVIGVNTTRAWRHRNGDVSDAQIERVTRLLRQAGGQQLRVVVVHQPLAVTEPGDRPHLLQGHRGAVRAWAAAGADLLLGGHIHLPYTLALPGLDRRVWAVQAGTAVSSRQRPGVPNSVNIVRWEPARERCCRVERWDFLAQEHGFVRTLSTTLQPDRSPSGA
ncbi:metallophosphoesterase family protein [Hydrogenophaga sp. RWCD_12]|uniref:metallophosphoesterase family protein n=1 Tax=Hydrogenophaga sp. RWCD_12 TaxID=3391190 RepID=UPI0039848AB5